jgi:hypothetical protein
MIIEGSWRPKNMWVRWIRIRIRIRNTANSAPVYELNAGMGGGVAKSQPMSIAVHMEHK